MKSVTIHGKSANEITELVKTLRQAGLVQGQDFDFTFYPASWSSDDAVIRKHTVFNFYREEYSTYFTLKWT